MYLIVKLYPYANYFSVSCSSYSWSPKWSVPEDSGPYHSGLRTKFCESHRKCWWNWFTEGYSLDSCPRFITNHHNLWFACGFSSENRHFCSGLKLPSVRKGCPRSSGWLSNAMKRQTTLGHLEIWNHWAAGGQDGLRWESPWKNPSGWSFSSDLP